jgi:ATP-grasp in the biosynthetic pathway with Ter operon
VSDSDSMNGVAPAVASEKRLRPQRGVTSGQRRRVLVTDGGNGWSRDTIAAVRALYEGGYRPSVAISGRSRLAAPSRYCEQRIVVPTAEQPGYREAVLAEAEKGDYLTVLPSDERALVALGVAVPHLLNKVGLNAAAERAGILVPPSRLFASLEALLSSADDLEFPVVVKPTTRRYWAVYVDSPARLARAETDHGPALVQPFLMDEPRAVSGVMWQGRLVAAVHERWLRIWPVPCGLPSAAETVPAESEVERRLETLLQGYDGVFNAQFAGPYLLDLNLRVHSTLPLAVSAGVNLVARYCDLLRGETAELVRARPGVFFRWLEGDVRHVIAGLRTGTIGLPGAVRILRPRRGAAHSIESIRDPMPGVARAWIAVSRRILRRPSSPQGLPQGADRDPGPAGGV